MLVLPRNDLLKQEILEKVIVKFSKDKKYNGMEVKTILQSCDVEDYVLFRRELVNFGYFGRDPYTDIYWVLKYKLSDEDMKKIGSNMKKFEEGGVY